MKMRMTSIVKVALLAVTVALPASVSVASAKKMAPPPGSCAQDKKWIASNTVCSFSCDPATKWCSQQYCLNGVKTPVLPCYSGFCTATCGG